MCCQVEGWEEVRSSFECQKYTRFVVILRHSQKCKILTRTRVKLPLVSDETHAGRSQCANSIHYLPPPRPPPPESERSVYLFRSLSTDSQARVTEVAELCWLAVLHMCSSVRLKLGVRTSCELCGQRGKMAFS